MTRDTSHFDYIIIGSGLAGFQLALKMASDSFFSDKKIALIDPSKKTKNDKTWSFWEKQPSFWDDLVFKSWQKASIITSKDSITLNLVPYCYKTIKSIDFYSYAKQILNNKKNFIVHHETVTNTSELEYVKVTTDKNTYTAHHVFDSRIPDTFNINTSKHSSIIQHFKGWVIRCNTNVFDNHCMTMMDFRLKDGNQTTFTYVLPFSKNEALIEFTYFTKETVEASVYDEYIAQYITNYLNIDSYTIVETEIGQIPMTDYPFEKLNTLRITKIGTAGGWVKGSTGYAFKHTEKKAHRIIENIKANRLPTYKLSKKRFKFYDKIFLKVLQDENEKGEWIFYQFYKKNNVQTMFKFLDEESTFFEDLQIMWSLFSFSFIKAFFKTL
ncbi:lycopene cyclase [Tamlana fucoidanivorans]|uniref:Lycopene cyclase n=1 Tax=Allotamlana fucoidanivorans TaxID=2583814 RepID=A0A5C4SHN3_9FLAO|nr:lycopene cyclase family protein [Tamlana fucoidanivorans]TNJ43165.1 lycopene cyclase [Tamlana fucoidanivorans]